MMMNIGTTQSMSPVSAGPIDQTKILYNLYRGHPNKHLLPTAEIQSIMASMLEDDQKDSLTRALSYGASAGDDELISALRFFLNRHTADDDVGDITSTHWNSEFFITNGVSHGLELLCLTCTNPGDEVWIERPTYFLVPKIFLSHRLVVKPLPMISDRQNNIRNVNLEDIGRIDLDRIITAVELEGVQPPKMIYIIPSYHNPTGRSMTVQERIKISQFAIKNNILLVADEVYHLLDWEQNQNKDGINVSNNLDDTATLISPSRRPAKMATFNCLHPDSNNLQQTVRGCCISVSSFTKIFAPGVRLGWIEAPLFIIQRLSSHGYICSQGGVAPFMGKLMTHAMESRLLDKYLDKIKSEYKERCELVSTLLKDEPRIAILTNRLSTKRFGGYFLWVNFPANVDCDKLLSHSLRNYGVKFMPGRQSDPFPMMNDITGISIRSCARLCFADVSQDQLGEATTMFLEAFRTFMEMMPSNRNQ